MIIKYICIEEFEIPFCDEDGGNTKKFYIIKKGSQWNLDPALSGTDLKLKNNRNEDVFIDISNETLDNYFVQMIDEIQAWGMPHGTKSTAIIVLPKFIAENEIMKEAKRFFKEIFDSSLCYLDDNYSEIGIKIKEINGIMTDVVTNIEEESLYKVWQVEINEYPF